jgi:ribonuclease HII
MAARPNFSLEKACSGVVAGVDEAGRGPWAGPVVAAAVILNPKRRPTGINDSKKLPAPEREIIFDAIVKHAITGVGIASVEEIDSLNILGATKLAMCRAVEQLEQKPDIALVDGNSAPALACTVKTVIGGDSLCLSIAAASIIAKVTRDRLMRALAIECPGYGWEHNAGYGTACHQEALARLGVTRHHRRSFRPIRELLGLSDPLRELAG